MKRAGNYRVLAIHNYYKNIGGEDIVYDTETKLLESNGHEVIRFTIHNDVVGTIPPFVLAQRTIWNSDIYRELKKLVKQTQPDVAHFHNSFPLLSPSAYQALREEGIPIVQTLHDFRYFCINGLFFRNAHICEECITKAIQWPGFFHRCYRNSYAASGVALAANLSHRLFHTLSRSVNIFIALTDLSKRKYIQAGINSDKITIKPNCLYPVPTLGDGSGNDILYVGRLSAEKGVSLLLTAWRDAKIQSRGATLKIVGSGPLENHIRQEASTIPGVEYLGSMPNNEVIKLMQHARFIVVPSIWHEGFPRVIVESFAVGLPVITGSIGNTALIVDNMVTGLHYETQEPTDLVNKICQLYDSPETSRSMRNACRSVFENQYSPERTMDKLVEIYASLTL